MANLISHQMHVRLLVCTECGQLMFHSMTIRDTTGSEVIADMDLVL